MQKYDKHKLDIKETPKNLIRISWTEKPRSIFLPFLNVDIWEFMLLKMKKEDDPSFSLLLMMMIDITMTTVMTMS